MSYMQKTTSHGQRYAVDSSNVIYLPLRTEPVGGSMELIEANMRALSAGGDLCRQWLSAMMVTSLAM